MGENKAFQHSCIRCGREFRTSDIGEYYCSKAHRELANAGSNADKVPLTFTADEKRRWDKNLERYASRKRVLRFGRASRPGWRREQSLASA